jgi:hypothetical protein
MEKAGALENVDGLSVHPYASNPHAVLAVYEKFEKQVRGLGCTGDIWVTEAGFPVAGYYPWRTPEKKLGDTIIKTLTLLAAKGARAIVWYQLTESYVKAHTPKTIDSEDFFGIAYRDYEKREGAALFGVLIKAIAGAEYLRDWPGKGELPPGITAFCFKKPSGELLLVRWAKNMPAVLEKR